METGKKVPRQRKRVLSLRGRKVGTVERKRREWHYVLEPKEYEVYCNRGGRINKTHRTGWSEWAGMIWCYKCKKDMEGFGGIFTGPIPYEVTKLMMGRHVFWRWNLKKKVIETDVHRRCGIHYRAQRKMTDRLIAFRKSGGKK